MRKSSVYKRLIKMGYEYTPLTIIYSPIPIRNDEATILNRYISIYLEAVLPKDYRNINYRVFSFVGLQPSSIIITQTMPGYPSIPTLKACPSKATILQTNQPSIYLLLWITIKLLPTLCTKEDLLSKILLIIFEKDIWAIVKKLLHKQSSYRNRSIAI